MAQRITIGNTPDTENANVATTPGCCHHWVIQPADGPISNGSCQVCGETREFKNYVESATWGDSRTTAKGTTAATDSTSDDDDQGSPDPVGDEPDIDPDDSEIEVETED